MQTNIYPNPAFISRSAKEQLLGQKGIVIWMTGLSGSGKTTIATELQKRLHEEGKLTQVLDGDNIRAGLNSNLGFSEDGRMENIRRIAEVAKLFCDCGIITICCFVSPATKMRELAKSIIGENDFVEVFVNAPLEICEQRDVKGLYAKARKGEIRDFTGVSAPFEAPASPALEIKTSELTVKQSTEKIIAEFFRK